MSSAALIFLPISCNIPASTPLNWSGSGHRCCRRFTSNGRIQAEVVSQLFRETLYAGHPLHRPISGYAHTVSRITREDVVAFHQRFYVPNNAIVVMVGALS